MIKRVYIAGPLFSYGEKEFNKKIDKYIHTLGFETFLPQRDGYMLADALADAKGGIDASNLIFNKDLDEIKRCDIVVFIMDGRVPDEGACVEIGLAYAYGKECIGFKSDTRYLMDGMDNPLIFGALKGRIARSSEDLKKYLQELL